MKILKVIHGYPKRYNAGSEVYSQLLCHELANRHEVQVFTREENVFEPDYLTKTEKDSLDPRITLNLINIPGERHKNRYYHDGVNKAFLNLIKSFQPDIVHIGHLNHLSTGIVYECAKQEIPIIYTLHDFWLACPRGQFLMRNSTPPFKLCSSQENKKCAEFCYAGDGAGLDLKKDIQRTSAWVEERMNHMKEISQHINHFISPSLIVAEKVSETLGLSSEKISILDYGFNLNRLQNKIRQKESSFVFGYIGTHIPSKGIQDLIEAFSKLDTNKTLLKIWGRERAAYTPFLKNQIQKLPESIQRRIFFMGEYSNEHIVSDVFNHVDTIVVPSIWYENSPLVIHEAQQVKVPVITTNLGGMAEYVLDEVNGLTFTPRDTDDLASKMSRLSKDDSLCERLAQSGYLYSANTNVPEISEHVLKVEEIYQKVIGELK